MATTPVRFVRIVHSSGGNTGTCPIEAFPYWEARGYQLVDPTDAQYLDPAPDLTDDEAVLFLRDIGAPTIAGQVLDDRIRALGGGGGGGTGGSGLGPGDTVLPAGATTATIQAAIDKANVAGGGTVYGGKQTFTVNGLTMRSDVVLRDMTLRLADGANADVIRGAGWSALTGTGGNIDTSGLTDFALDAVTIDGNRANQTGTDCSGLRVYGRNFVLRDVLIYDCAGDGLVTEWGNYGDVLHAMEAVMTGMKVHDNAGWGWHNSGPHDSTISDVQVFDNNQGGYPDRGGIWFRNDDALYSAGGSQLTAVHTWGQSQRWGAIFDCTVYVSNSQFEGAEVGNVLLKSNAVLHGGRIFTMQGQDVAAIGLQIGDDGNTPGVPNPGVANPGNFDVDTTIDGSAGASRGSAAIAWVGGNQGRVRVHSRILSTVVAASDGGRDVFGWSGVETLAVASTVGFPDQGTLRIPTSSQSNGGRAYETLSYTGRTPNSFTGVTTLNGGYGGISEGTPIIGDSPLWTPDGQIDAQSEVQVSFTAPFLSEALRGVTSRVQTHGSQRWEVGLSNNAWLITSGQQDLLNVNASGRRLELVRGMRIDGYSDAYGTRTFRVDGATGGITPGGPGGSDNAAPLHGGTGAPTFTAPPGSIYFRKDGAAAGEYVYRNTDGGTTWVGIL